MIDNKLTQDIQTWLANNKHDEASLVKGAEMMLKLNRNMAMYQTVMRRPSKFESKIRYELHKFLPMRLEKQTLQDVKTLDRELIPEVKSAIEPDRDADGYALTSTANGQRPDHDSLPDNIKSIWNDNRLRWQRIKQLYNSLLAIEQPCDRYEYLKQLKDLWYTYKRELERYDNYVAPGADDSSTLPTPPPSASDIAKDIANARSYITKYIDRLVELHHGAIGSDDATKALNDYNNLLAKIQQRVAVLTDNAAPIGDEIKAKLNEAGLSIPTAE